MTGVVTSPLVVITGPNLVPLTDPIDSVTGIDVVLRDNDIGSGSFTAPAYPRLMSVIAPGNRVRIDRGNQVLISGPIRKPGALSWSTSDPTQGGPGMVSVTFDDNLAYLSGRLTYPTPAAAAAAQTADYYTATGTNAETLIRTIVDVNAGPGALVARRVPGLVLGAVAGVGSLVNVTTRFQPLPDVLRTLAVAGGHLQFRITDTGAALSFAVTARRNLAAGPGTVRFSRYLGNLIAYQTDPDAPTATVAVVGGEGSGATRLIVERSTSATATWGRIETFVDQSGVSDTTGLNQYGDAALADAAEKVAVTVTAIGAPGAVFGVDYQLGDLVGVDLVTGVGYVDAVTAVSYKWSPDGGEVTQPTIGGTDPHVDTPTVTALRNVVRQLGQVQAR